MHNVSVTTKLNSIANFLFCVPVNKGHYVAEIPQ